MDKNIKNVGDLTIYLEELINKEEFSFLKKEYRRWYDFIENHIDFWLKNTEHHTKLHSARVLLFCLLISQKLNLSKVQREILAIAACYHDSRRIDDWLDRGHGKRAAQYYKESCKDLHLPYYEVAYELIAYHDQDDQMGIKRMKEKFDKDPTMLLLYQVFKDADGLDRLRLGENALDVKYLRIKESLLFVELSKQLNMNCQPIVVEDYQKINKNNQSGHYLIVFDVSNDLVDGALETKEVQQSSI